MIEFYIVAIIIAGLISYKFYVYDEHRIYKVLDRYGAIQIYDDHSLIAILYCDKTIDWMGNTSLIKRIKIKMISNNFNKEYDKLKNKKNATDK